MTPELLSELKSKVSACVMSFETAMDTLYQAAHDKIASLSDEIAAMVDATPVDPSPAVEVAPPSIDPAVPLDLPEQAPASEPVAGPVPEMAPDIAPADQVAVDTMPNALPPPPEPPAIDHSALDAAEAELEAAKAKLANDETADEQAVIDAQAKVDALLNAPPA